MMGNKWKAFAEALLTAYDTHIHGSASGPTGPPTVPSSSNTVLAVTSAESSTGTGAPLSTKVKVKE